MRESEDGAWVRFADHEEKLQQFERLRRYAYQVLAEAHQVLWEVDRIPELSEMVEKEAAKDSLATWGLSQEQYDSLVRDAMNWRSAMNSAGDTKAEPKPFDLPPGVEPRLKTLQDAAGAVRIALKDFYPHGENAAAAIMAMTNESRS